MDDKAKSNLELLMGAIIIVADLYWTYTSYTYLPWLVLGIIILVAALVWIALDLNLSMASRKAK